MGGRGAEIADASGKIEIKHIRSVDGVAQTDNLGRKFVDPFTTHAGKNPLGVSYSDINAAYESAPGGYKDRIAYVWHYHPESNLIEAFVPEPSGWDIDDAVVDNQFVISSETGTVYFYNKSTKKENVENGKAVGQTKGSSGEIPENKFYDIKEGAEQIK
ncbi:hypothetical protein D3C71_27870 [compost metagenome]